MSDQWYRRIAERDRGRRRLRRLTGWTATAGVTLSGVFGLAFARHDQPAEQSQGPGDIGGVISGPGSDAGSTGESSTSGYGGGSVIQPPAQLPAPTRGQGHVSSGGS